MAATFYQPARGLGVWLRGALRRYNCGRRFGHFMVSDSFGYPSCSRCGSPLL